MERILESEDPEYKDSAGLNITGQTDIQSSTFLPAIQFQQIIFFLSFTPLSIHPFLSALYLFGCTAMPRLNKEGKFNEIKVTKKQEGKKGKELSKEIICTFHSLSNQQC